MEPPRAEGLPNALKPFPVPNACPDGCGEWRAEVCPNALEAGFPNGVELAAFGG